MAQQQLSKLDERMAARDDAKTAIIYSMRNWQAYYMLPGNTHSHDNYLEKAYLGAMAAHRKNEPSPWLFSLAIFMAIESRHLDTAATMLESAMGYSSFLKTNEPFYYNVFLFLRAYLAAIENRARVAKKYRKAFLSQLKSTEYSPYYDVMIGQLHLATTEHTQAYGYFARAYSYGCRSMYLYEGLFRSISEADSSEIGEELLPLLINAAFNGADISRATAIHEEAVFSAIMQNPAAGERLYALSKHTPLLKPICANRMDNEDLSMWAHDLYSQASRHQINLRGLSTFLVQASYVNHIEKIDTYPLQRFLSNSDSAEHVLAGPKNHDGHTPASETDVNRNFYRDPQFAAYVFHLLLTDPAHRSLLLGRENMALEAAVHCLENDVSGREANSLYQFFWAHSKSINVTDALMQKAEAELQAGLTQFELIITKDTRYVYIALQEKRGSEEYAVTENHPMIIEAPHENFSYTCLGAGRRSAITEPLVIKRMTPLANPELYQHFFDKGDRRFHILAYLASHYLTAEAPQAIPVYEAILAEKSLQKPYRMKILAALGHLYHAARNHTKAQECYAQIDMTTLPPSYLQQTLNVCLQTNEYALATELIAQNHKSLPAEAVYEGLHQLLKNTHTTPENTGKHLSEAAYNLLISGHHSETLLTTVLTHYHASQSELKVLSNTLKTPDPRLYIKILSGDLWSHHCDTHTQKAFRQLMQFHDNNETTARKAKEECIKFIEYCTYAMLTHNLIPEYETINILEKYYQANTHSSHDISSQNNLLLLALSHTYLANNITTFRSDKLLTQAIALQEAAGILLPIFKENKPITHPYLEKYHPFLFQSQPNKDIRLNYRLDETKDFLDIPMQYLAYGLYTAKLPLFYNETITYYYSEEMPTGSITTHHLIHKNTTPFLHNHPNDNFFAINNAIIHEHTFRHQEVEDIICDLTQEPTAIQGQLL